jgi:hypothetical protein
MNDIAGIPYFVAEFDVNGQLNAPVTLPADVDEVIVVSHGWNNDRADAESLYSALFSSFAAIGGAPRGKAAIVGVIWPSKRFDELVSATAATPRRARSPTRCSSRGCARWRPSSRRPSRRRR